MKETVVCLWEIPRADWQEYSAWTGDTGTYSEYVARLNAARHVAEDTGCDVIVWTGSLDVLRQTIQDMGLKNTPENRAQAIALLGARPGVPGGIGRPVSAPEPTGSVVHDPIRSALYSAVLVGHSQVDIAGICGVTQQALSRYLRGDRYLKEPALTRLVLWLRENGMEV